jgi:glycolate oxidase
VTASRGDVEAFLAAVRAAVPDLRLLTDELDRESYRRDETPYLASDLPAAVALPTSTGEVAALVRLAGEHRVPLVPRGAGTGLSGGANGVAGAVTVAFTRMDRILEIDEANLVAIVQPGVVNADLKKAAADRGLFYAPDPASYETCTIGGNLSTNAGGLCCVKYGQTRESVLGLEVVLADGSVVRTGGRNMKDVAGYSLTHLIVGSQGTLALITEATLRLRPMPPTRATLVAFFGEVEHAGRAVSAIATEGLAPVTLELLDRESIRAVDDVYALGLERDAEAMLLIESDLPGEAARREIERATTVCEREGATLVVQAADPQEADWLRQARRMAWHALERQGSAKMEDVVVPRSQVAPLLRAIARAAEHAGVRCATFGHAGDGNLHPNLVFDRDDPTAEAKTEAFRDELYRTAIELGGSVTGEHGIGSSRTGYLELQRGAAAVGAMRRIKEALDPLGILNPGKVLPASAGTGPAPGPGPVPGPGPADEPPTDRRAEGRGAP